MKKYLIAVLALSFSISGCQLIPPNQENKTSSLPQNSVACTENSCSLSSPNASPSAQIISGEETVRQFFSLIDAQKQDEVMPMLSDYMIPDEPTKIMWHDSFTSLKKAKLVSLQKWEPANWTPEKERFEIVVNTQTESGELQYGWEVGENTRWIEVVKKPGTQEWQINEIASGP